MPEIGRSSRIAGTLTVAGGVAMVLGGLTSWNLFWVGTYQFHGKSGIAGGTHLAAVILGVGALISGRAVLRASTPSARRARLSPSLVLTGSLGVFWLSRYADTMKASLERSVVSSFASSIAASTGTSVASVTASLQSSIAQNDVDFSLRTGFYLAFVGALLVLAGGAVLFIPTRADRRALRARRGTRKPDQGLANVVLPTPRGDGGGVS